MNDTASIFGCLQKNATTGFSPGDRHVYGCAEECPRPNPFIHSTACHNYTSYPHLSWGVVTFSLIQNHQSACRTVISIVQLCSHKTLLLLSPDALPVENKWTFIQCQSTLLWIPNFKLIMHSKSMFNCKHLWKSMKCGLVIPDLLLCCSKHMPKWSTTCNTVYMSVITPLEIAHPWFKSSGICANVHRGCFLWTDQFKWLCLTVSTVKLYSAPHVFL